MAQKYNIYINEKTLIVVSSLPNNLQNYQVINVQEFDFEIFYHSLNNNPYAVFVILTSQPKNIFLKIQKSLRVIEAAGGLVRSNEDKYLFIKRNGLWDLPKGKLELGEKKKDAAVREVEEECGIEVKKLGKKLLKTYHIYELKGKIVLKISHWYKMRALANQALVPQLEEGITEVKWIGKEDWNLVRANTYPSIIDVLEKN
jgi:8-oxo-dGTP pyrophosphatase MutT (NUDIX family)